MDDQVEYTVKNGKDKKFPFYFCRYISSIFFGMRTYTFYFFRYKEACRKKKKVYDEKKKAYNERSRRETCVLRQPDIIYPYI